MLLTCSWLQVPMARRPYAYVRGRRSFYAEGENPTVREQRGLPR